MNQKKNNQLIHQHWGQLGRSILNGMIGDYLATENNPLAIKMGFYHHRNPLRLDRTLPLQVDFKLTNKVVIFVHGLTDMESVWDFPSVDTDQSASFIRHYIETCFQATKCTNPENYGKKLQQDFGYSPFYVRYNTGIHVEKNGRELATLLTKLIKTYPIEIDELMLVGFNMGGTLIRHAQSYAWHYRSPWLDRLSKCVYLGPQNKGSAGEKFAYFSREVMRLMSTQQFNPSCEWVADKVSQLEKVSNKIKPHVVMQIPAQKTDYADSSRHYFIFGGDKINASTHIQTLPNLSQNAVFEDLPHYPLAHSECVYGQIARWVEQDEQCHWRQEANHKPPLIHYEPPALTDLLSADITDSTPRTFIAGTIDLMASTYEKALENIETTHYSISEQPFYLLQKYPIVSQLANPIEKLHRNMLNVVYKTLRDGGRFIHQLANAKSREEARV